MDPALAELLRTEAGTDGDRVLEAIIRFARLDTEIPDVRIVARFGHIATCRIRARDVMAVRARPDVISVKAARGLSPGLDPAFDQPESAIGALPGIRPTDVRRDPALTLTGAGVVVAAVDWGLDVDSAALRWPDDPAAAGHHRPGGTRLLSFWDQRDHSFGPCPAPYGYGTVHGREAIDMALQSRRPYQQLGYHPAIADPKGKGSHGMRTIHIAAGNGRDGGPEGIAPEADLIFVHLADRDSGGLAPFGDSVRALEAVDFISRTAGSQPCSINISAGRICGPHTGTSLVEMAFDELLATRPGRFISQSCGNYAHWRTHSCGIIAEGETRSLTVVVDPVDITVNEVEIWYDGADEFTVRIDPPGYTGGRAVRLGERSDLLIEGRVIGRVYHRRHDPNNGDNHIVAYLDPVGYSGNWTVTLEAQRTVSGRFHAWIERDDSCPGCQARFIRSDTNIVTTIGSITTSNLPLIVGAYNAHDPARPPAPFSSYGPTRDGRLKPDLVAPGVEVLAARSAPFGANHNSGLLVRGSGTSFAAPHVTGAVALCFQAAGNRLGADEIRSLVLGSCDAVPDSDPHRFGRGYLNIPRLVADLRRAIDSPATVRHMRETAMDTEETVMLLAAVPSTAYREYLYRPHGRFAQWIDDRFEVVARPGRPMDVPIREGDVLLEVALGRAHKGRCVTVTGSDLEFLGSRPGMSTGRLVLRPRRRAEMSAPLLIEPIVDATGGINGTDLNRLTPRVLPQDQVADAVAPRVTEPDPEADTSESENSPTGEESDAVRETNLAVTADAAPPPELAAHGAAETLLFEADRVPVRVDADAAYQVGDAGWRPWTDLIVHHVPDHVIADLRQRGIAIQRLRDAYGDINLDDYSVKISRMPFLHGKQMAPEGLLAHVRDHFETFIDTNNSSFPPLNNSLDKPRWESDNPVGAVIDIHVHLLRIFTAQALVVCSLAEPRRWVFTTVHSESAGYHPVTGNRMWGIRQDDDGWILFTRGADRATRFHDWFANLMNIIWAGADALWCSFQAKVCAFINANQGSAVVVPRVWNRWPWQPIQSQLSFVFGEEISSEGAGPKDWPSASERYQLSITRGDGETAELDVPAARLSTDRSANQRARLDLILAIQDDERASFRLLDDALSSTPAYAAYVTIRQRVILDAARALDEARDLLVRESAATAANEIKAKLEQAQLWLFFLPPYAHLAALIRAAEHDRLPSVVQEECAREADSYAKAFSLIARGRPSDLQSARDNALSQVDHTRQLLQSLNGAISKGKEAVHTAESIERVLDIPIEYAAGRVLPPGALVAILAADRAGFYLSHKPLFDIILPKAPTFVAELGWLEANAPVTRRHILHPIYLAIGRQSVHGVSASDVAFIVGRTIYLLAQKQSPASWGMALKAATKATLIVTALHLPKLTVYGIDRLAARTRTSVLNAIGGEKDPHGVLDELRKQVGEQLSQDEALDLLIELTSDPVVEHIENLAACARAISPPIAAIVADVQGTGMATSTTVLLAINYPLLPAAP